MTLKVAGGVPELAMGNVISQASSVASAHLASVLLHGLPWITLDEPFQGCDPALSDGTVDAHSCRFRRDEVNMIRRVLGGDARCGL